MCINTGSVILIVIDVPSRIPAPFWPNCEHYVKPLWQFQLFPNIIQENEQRPQGLFGPAAYLVWHHLNLG